MSKAEEKKSELLALGKEMTRRDDEIIAAYKKTHKLPSRKSEAKRS